MKPLSKSIHSFLLILLMGILGIASSIAASEPVTAVECFAYDGQCQATIGYDGGLPPAFAYDSAATLTAEREANRRAGASTFFDKVAKFLAADTGLVLNNPGGGTALPMSIVRTIDDDGLTSDIVNELKSLTFDTGNEHAVVTHSTGENAIVAGVQGESHSMRVKSQVLSVTLTRMMRFQAGFRLWETCRRFNNLTKRAR